MSVTVQVPMPLELKEKLEAMAKEQCQTLAAIVRSLIVKGLAQDAATK